MNWYCEFARQPYKRSGNMIPVSSLPEFYKQDDAGYSSYYWFTKEAADEIKTQGHSAGLSRFPVYSQFLVIDIDRDNDMFSALADTFSISNKLQDMGLKHSLWFSGGKGCHIYIHTEPMFDINLPYSHLCWVRENLEGYKTDESLYQHGRLLSNPGRRSQKTRIRKHKIMDHGGALARIRLSQRPIGPAKPENVGTVDLARIAFFRAQKAMESEPSSRHTTIWSLSGAFAEAGMEENTTIELMRFINNLWKTPKDDEGLIRAVRQSYQQISHQR